MSGEEEEDLVMLKLQVIKRSGRDHTRAQMALNYRGLRDSFCLKRDDHI